MMRHDNPPYHSAALDEALAQQLRHINVAMREADDAIRDIAAVGALIDMGGNMMPSDMQVIAAVCAELAAAGLPVHPAPRLQIYNLLPPVGSDFLRAAWDEGTPKAPKADLVVTCYVFGGSARAAGFDRLRPEQRQGFDNFSQIYRDNDKFALDRLIGVSALQDFPGIWAQSAYNTGARFVATYGDAQDEICTKHFNQAACYKTLIATEEKYRRSGFGYSYGSFGFLVREGEKPQRPAKPATLLARRLG